jgi:tyrosinase
MSTLAKPVLLKMRLELLLHLLALGATVLAAWTPAQESDAAKQLDVMAQKALNATLALLDSDVAAAKAAGLTPNCTREKLQYRVEL